MIQLTFTDEFIYPDSSDGITIPTLLRSGDRAITDTAKVDTGAEVCLFRREIGEELGLPLEQGLPVTLRSLAGPVEAFGHEVTIQTGNFSFQSFVYFAKYPGLPRNILGRRGWLRNLRFAVIDYDNLLYLSDYHS